MVVGAGPGKATSLAGTWGEEQRKQYLFTNSFPTNTGGYNPPATGGTNSRSESPTKQFRASSSLSASRENLLKDAARFSTVAQSTYTAEVFAKSRDTEPTKYHKFKSLQQTGAAVLAGQVYEGVDNFGFTTNNLLEEESKPPEDNLSTTQRDSYKPYRLGASQEMGTGFEAMEEQAHNIDLHRTNSRLLRSSAAPMAVGRSGLRKERGVATSGLSGERLNLDDDPKRNSFADRAWLYYDDPALKIRYNGRPVAEPVTELSLTLPSEVRGEKSNYDPNANHGRKYYITGSVTSKTGAAMAGVFMDDYPAVRK